MELPNTIDVPEKTGIASFFRRLWYGSKRWLKIVSIWFLIGALIGATVFFLVPEILEQLLETFADKFGDEPALDINLALAIFFNNLKVSAIALFGGLLLGIGPFIVVMTNAFILGYILMSIVVLSPGSTGESLLLIGVGILPHGILEIPAFLFAAALGLKLGIDWLKQENFGQRTKVFVTNLKYVLLAGIPAVVVMLFIAAIIEVYVSGNLLESLV